MQNETDLDKIGGSVRGSVTKSSSDNLNNEDNSGSKNIDQSTNDGSNKGVDDNLQSVEPAKTGEQP